MSDFYQGVAFDEAVMRKFQDWIGELISEQSLRVVEYEFSCTYDGVMMASCTVEQDFLKPRESVDKAIEFWNDNEKALGLQGFDVKYCSGGNLGESKIRITAKGFFRGESKD